MKNSQRKILLPEMNPEQVSTEIGNFIIQKVIETKSTGGVIGLSGGVDSTVTAALAKRAFDRYSAIEPEREMELVGYVLPSKINESSDTEDGLEVAKQLGLRCELIDIEPVVEAYRHTNGEAFKTKYNKGNLTCRIRANILSTKAATEKKLVIGTGNKDEDFGIGYYTLFGDGAVHLSPIGNLPKRLVKQMALYVGFEKIAAKNPTAGLEPGQTDFSDLGYDYDVVELVLEGLKQGFPKEELYSHYQINELVKAQLSKSTKFDSVEDVVNDIVARHYTIALPKMKLLHPEAAKISLWWWYGCQDRMKSKPTEHLSLQQI